MSSPQFTHLHVHTEYSLVDGAIRIEALVDRVKALGQNAVAVTDHGNLYGAIDFYLQAKAKGIKAIIGVELYMEAQSSSRELFKKYPSVRTTGLCFQMVALAKNLNGYQNLLKLVSSGYLNPPHSGPVPIVPLSELEKYGKDLFLFPSFSGGEIAALLQLKAAHPDASSEIDEALTACVLCWRRVSDPDALYLEICRHNIPNEEISLEKIVGFSRQQNIPILASSNAHYLMPDDHDAHTVLLAIKNDLKLPQLRDRRQGVQAHLATPQEIAQQFADYPEAIANTNLIASQCNVQFSFGKYFLPKLTSGAGETTDDTLIRLSKEGLQQRLDVLQKLYGPEFDANKQQTYWQRLEYESGVICKMGFSDYFLIVQDFINWAKEHDIPVGPGRGSGAGSLVAYALRITDLDPIPYNLIFERFLNPERISMPDFDVDFCQDRRDEVIRYVMQRYGSNQVAQITTFGKMLAKAVIRDVGRVLDISYGKVDRIAKLIPEEIGITLREAVTREPRIAEESSKDPLVADMLKFALQLEGLNRHTSVHAAGIVISDGRMDQYVPVYLSTDGSLITQYEMKNAEKVGLVKFDFLGLKTLTVIKRAVELIRSTTGDLIDIDKIPLNDRKVYQLISKAFSVGIFQLESPGMQKLLMKLQPSTFEDIIALVALFRPGPLQSGMVDDFVERKHGRQKIEYLHPALEEILKDTYGTILYQEQVQKIAAILASYTLGEADLLRRAMGKKKPEEMAKEKPRFVERCVANKIDEQIASTLFDLMAKFAEYGFNKSHSAAYGLVSYQTGYLKANFPAQFLAASMTCDMDNTDKLIRYTRDCAQFRIQVLGPCINHSELEFTVPKPKVIRYALSAIKGVGVQALEPLIESRKMDGAFTGLSSLAKRVDLNQVGKKTLELLCYSGALDGFGFCRKALFNSIGSLVSFSRDYHEAHRRGQISLFGEADNANEEPDQFANIVLANATSKSDQFDLLQQEKKLLGSYISKHPLSLFSSERDRYCNARLGDLPKLTGQSDIYVMAMLYDQFERTTKDNRKMLILRLDDESGDLAPGFFEGNYPKKVLSNDSVVVAKFRVTRAFENIPARVKIEDIWTLEEYRQMKTKSLSIVLRSGATATDSEMIGALNDVLNKYPGATPVHLQVQMPDVRIDFGNLSTKIVPSDAALKDLEGILAKFPYATELALQ